MADTKPPRIEIRQHRALIAALYPKLPVISSINPDYKVSVSDYRPLIEQTVDLLHEHGHIESGYYDALLLDGLAEIDHETLIA